MSKLPIDESIYEQGYNQAIKDLDSFDWAAFRREAALAVLTALMQTAYAGLGSVNIKYWTGRAVAWADALIEELETTEK